MDDDERKRALDAFVQARGVTACPPGDNTEFFKYRLEQARRQSNARASGKAKAGRGPKGGWKNPTDDRRGGWQRRTKASAEPLIDVEDALLKHFGYSEK